MRRGQAGKFLRKTWQNGIAPEFLCHVLQVLPTQASVEAIILPFPIPFATGVMKGVLEWNRVFGKLQTYELQLMMKVAAKVTKAEGGVSNLDIRHNFALSVEVVKSDMMTVQDKTVVSRKVTKAEGGVSNLDIRHNFALSVEVVKSDMMTVQDKTVVSRATQNQKRPRPSPRKLKVEGDGNEDWRGVTDPHPADVEDGAGGFQGCITVPGASLCIKELAAAAQADSDEETPEQNVLSKERMATWQHNFALSVEVVKSDMMTVQDKTVVSRATQNQKRPRPSPRKLKVEGDGNEDWRGVTDPHPADVEDGAGAVDDEEVDLALAQEISMTERGFQGCITVPGASLCIKELAATAQADSDEETPEQNVLSKERMATWQSRNCPEPQVDALQRICRVHIQEEKTESEMAEMKDDKENPDHDGKCKFIVLTGIAGFVNHFDGLALDYGAEMNLPVLPPLPPPAPKAKRKARAKSKKRPQKPDLKDAKTEREDEGKREFESEENLETEKLEEKSEELDEEEEENEKDMDE
eukprot:s78_g18.t1